MEEISVTQLRANIYKILDRLLETGEELIIRRGKHRLVITPRKPKKLILSELPQRKATTCDPEELINISWENEWKPNL